MPESLSLAETLLVSQVGQSENPSAAMNMFLLYSDQLAGWKFAFGSPTGPKRAHAIGKQFPGTASIKSLFRQDAVLVVDENTHRDFIEGRASTYSFDYSVSLDTNAFSYIQPYLDGRVVPLGVAEVLRFISKADVNVDPEPYLLENIPYLLTGQSSAQIFSKIKSYEVIRSVDLEQLNKSNLVRSMLTEPELVRRAQTLLSTLVYDFQKSGSLNGIRRSYGLMYSLLLSMITLNLVNGPTPATEKLLTFLQFQSDSLGAICQRESVIALEYFRRGRSLQFFDRVDLNREDLFKQIRNMAFDFLHIRNMEHAVGRKWNDRATYHFPALLTFDRKMIDIVDMFPLRSYAIGPENWPIIPFFEKDWFKLITDKMNQYQLEKAQDFFSATAVEDRSARVDVRMNDLDNTIEAQEKALARAAKIVPPTSRQF